MGLGGRVAELLAAGGRRLHALLVAHELPPAGVQLISGHVLAVELRLPLGHGAAGPVHEGDGHLQGIVQQHLHLVGLVVRRQHARGLEVRDLPRGHGDELAHALVEAGVGAVPQEGRHLGPGVAHEVVAVAQLVVDGLEPLGVGLHAHEGADVVVQIQVPAGGVGVLLAGVAGLHGVEVGLGPEARGQRVEAQAHIEGLGGLHDALGLPALEVGVEVHGTDEAGPVLAPPVVDPVGGDGLGHGLAVFLRHLVLHPGVQLEVEGLQLREELPVEGHHLVGGQAVAGHLEGEVVGVAQLPGHAVAEVAQAHQAILQGHADLLAGLPPQLALGQIAAGGELVVDVVGADGPAAHPELVAVHDGDLLRLRLDAGGHELRLGHGSLGPVGHEQHPLQLAHGLLVELAAVLQQLLGFGDDHGTAIERGEGLARPLGGGVMLRLHIRGRGPGGLLAHVVEGLVAGIHQLEEAVRPFLDG